MKERLEELRDIALVLMDDAHRLESRLGGIAPTAVHRTNRRLYVRAVFALADALAEQHRQLLLDLHEAGRIRIERPTLDAIRETTWSVRRSGLVDEQRKYLSLPRKIRLVHRVAAAAFGPQADVDFDGEGWAAFRDALTVRDRVSHPKCFEDCAVTDEELERIDRGRRWYEGAQAAFLHAAARFPDRDDPPDGDSHA